MTKTSRLRLMIWNLVFFSYNIWKGQIGLGTLIFGQFLHFNDLQPFTYLWQKFSAWGSWQENWSFYSGLWKGQIVTGTQIFGQILHFSDLQQMWAWGLWHANRFFFLLLLWSLQAEILLSLLSIWRFDNSKGQSPFLWNEEWKIVSVFKDSLFDMKHSFPLCSSSLTVLNNAFKFSCDHLSNVFLTPYMLKDTLNPIFW